MLQEKKRKNTSWERKKKSWNKEKGNDRCIILDTEENHGLPIRRFNDSAGELAIHYCYCTYDPYISNPYLAVSKTKLSIFFNHKSIYPQLKFGKLMNFKVWVV